MNRMRWHRSAIVMQLVNVFMLFAFSICLSITAYPLVAFFQERGATVAYVLDVSLFVVLGFLVLIGWTCLRRGKPWAWWFAVSCDVLACLLTGSDFLSCGWRDLGCVPFAAMSLSSAVACIFLFMPNVRERYRRVDPAQFV